MTHDTQWIEGICSTDAGRPHLARPMVLHRDGTDFTIATDGQRMVELPGVSGPLTEPDERVLERIHAYLAPTPDTAVPLDWKLFRDFVKGVLKGKKAHEVRAYIGGVLFNARLFKPMIANLDTKTAFWDQTSPEKRALVDGVAWRFMVMPLRDTVGPQDRLAIPHFHIESARAAA